MSRKCIIEKYLHKARFCGDKTIEVPYNDLTMMCHLALDSLHTSRWIPVSERLPTEEDANSKGKIIAWCTSFNGTEVDLNWRLVETSGVITHWRVGMEPPKEVE